MFLCPLLRVVCAASVFDEYGRFLLTGAVVKNLQFVFS